MIPLYKPYMPEDLSELQNILYSGKLAAGDFTTLFEQKLKKYFNTSYVLVTNSFNSAVSVVLSTLGLKPGDEVVASPMACLASTQPYASYGAKIVWVDVLPENGTIDPDSLKKTITSKTKVIVHNHFCGYPGYIDEINQIGKENGVPVIDDGIESFGSVYNGEKIGNCGSDIAVFSFNPVRIPNTIDGGAIIFKDSVQYGIAKLIRDCGIDRTKFRDENGEINPCCDITLTGYSATMSNINGYIGVKQMEQVTKLLNKQQTNAQMWHQQIGGCDFTELGIEQAIPNYWVYGVLAKNKLDTILYFRKRGFYASGVHINNNIYSIFGDQGELKGVKEFYNHFVALPCGWWVDQKDIQRLVI